MLTFLCYADCFASQRAGELLLVEAWHRTIYKH